MVSKALSGNRVCDMAFKLSTFSSSFSPLTQSSKGKTCVAQVLTAMCVGMIPLLWDGVSDGDVECLHF